VSGRHDSQLANRNHELEEEVWNSRLTTGDIECAHIIPDSTNIDISDSKDKVRCHSPFLLHSSARSTWLQHECAASVWAILKCFGYEDLPERLNGTGIHSLDNVMTLDHPIHDWFDRLELWFEAVVGAFFFWTTSLRLKVHRSVPPTLTSSKQLKDCTSSIAKRTTARSP